MIGRTAVRRSIDAVVAEGIVTVTSRGQHEAGGRGAMSINMRIGQHAYWAHVSCFQKLNASEIAHRFGAGEPEITA
jgi:hypothetical protein